MTPPREPRNRIESGKVEHSISRYRQWFRRAISTESGGVTNRFVQEPENTTVSHRNLFGEAEIMRIGRTFVTLTSLTADFPDASILIYDIPPNVNPSVLPFQKSPNQTSNEIQQIPNVSRLG